MRLAVARPFVGAVALALALACDPVQGTSLSRAPVNACPEHACEAYKGTTKATCQSGRCETSSALPPYQIAVAVPETSSFAPGAMIIVPDKELNTPTTTHPLCPATICLSLPDLGVAQGTYKITRDAAQLVGLVLGPSATPPADPPQSLPERLTFFPLTGPAVETIPQGLPGAVLFTASRVLPDGLSVGYRQPLPAGRYLRLAEPEPPYDKYAPPVLSEVVVQAGATFADDFTLDRDALDAFVADPTGTARIAAINRDDDVLDGFRAWVEETKTHRRVSVVRPLKGTDANVRLDTHGQTESGAPGPAIRTGLSIVIAPPDTWIGVPRYETELSGGTSRLVTVTFPRLLPPVQQNGFVTPADAQGQSLGIPSRVTFTSQSIGDASSAAPDTKLRYDATLTTDVRGRFATVLPLGTYTAFVEPAEGTGYSRFTQTVDLPQAKSTALAAPRRAHAHGRATVADGRPLSGATVLFSPSQSPAQAAFPPRGGETSTNDAGEYQLDLDRGEYELAIIPESGTGLPRRVTVVPVTSDDVAIPDLVVPAPFRLAFTIRTPRENAPPLAHAVVRIYADATGGGSLVEVGLGITDSGGKCEILLAQ